MVKAWDMWVRLKSQTHVGSRTLLTFLLLCFKNEGKIPLTSVCAPLGTFRRRWAIIILIHQFYPSVRKTYATEILALGWVPNLILNDFLLKVCQHTVRLLLVGSQSVISEVCYRRYIWSKAGCRTELHNNPLSVCPLLPKTILEIIKHFWCEVFLNSHFTWCQV